MITFASLDKYYLDIKLSSHRASAAKAQSTVEIRLPKVGTTLCIRPVRFGCAPLHFGFAQYAGKKRSRDKFLAQSHRIGQERSTVCIRYVYSFIAPYTLFIRYVYVLYSVTALLMRSMRWTSNTAFKAYRKHSTTHTNHRHNVSIPNTHSRHTVDTP